MSAEIKVTQLEGHLNRLSDQHANLNKNIEDKLESIRNEISFANRTQAQNLELVKYLVESHIKEYELFRSEELKPLKEQVVQLNEAKNRAIGFALAFGAAGSGIGVAVGKLLT